MTCHRVPAHRPFVGVIAALLLASACGSATDSSSDETIPPADTPTAAPTSPSTTSPPSVAPDVPATLPPPPTTVSTTAPAETTSPPDTASSSDPLRVDAVDVAEQTVFDIGIFEPVDVDAVLDDVSARLGPPTVDSGWQPIGGQVNCAGSTEYRVSWWGDFRVTFERYEAEGASRDELSAWSVGDPTVSELAPIGDVPAGSPSDVVTLEGIGLGSSRVDIEAAWANVHDGDNRLVVIDRGGALVLRLDDGGRVVGFGNGPFDCDVDEVR